MLPVEDYFVEETNSLMAELQTAIEEVDFFAPRIHRSAWPTETQRGLTNVAPDFYKVAASGDLGVEMRTYSVKKCAINSPDICLDDIRQWWHLQDVRKRTFRTLRESLKWVWANTFRNEIIEGTRTHLLARKFNPASLPPDTDEAKERYPRAISFFGKEVRPFMPYSLIHAGVEEKWVVNPKYRRAAKQIIGFHPDTIHFQFLNPDHWAGELMWRNIPDRHRNADGKIGFYRVVMDYAARPVRPDLGVVVTVTPPGFLGFLWYCAWRLVGFTP